MFPSDVEVALLVLWSACSSSFVKIQVQSPMKFTEKIFRKNYLNSAKIDKKVAQVSKIVPKLTEKLVTNLPLDQICVNSLLALKWYHL